jgi:hypothetical protein
LKQEILMRKSLIVAVLSVLLLATAAVAEDEKQVEGPSFWMKQKLTFSENILDGLAKEDYELIQKNAISMKGLNTLEFFIRQKPEGYRTQLKTFEFSVNELVRNAEGKNLDGATLAFTQMTISCVNCHKELRKK